MAFLSGRVRPHSIASGVFARYLSLLFAALLPVHVVAASEDVGVSRERLARIETVLQRYVDEGRLAGAVVWVQRQGEDVLYLATGHRDREAAAPMETDSIFRIASMTKAVVSAAALMAMAAGCGEAGSGAGGSGTDRHRLQGDVHIR